MMDNNANLLKTGTSTLGITFKGGVVVGADHRATMGHFIANKSVQKLFQIGDRLALTTAGLVGHAQSLSRTLSAEVALFELRRQQPMTVKGAATLTANILSGRPHWVQLLIVGVDEDGGHVYSIDSAGGSIPDTYCATGSGSPYMHWSRRGARGPKSGWAWAIPSGGASASARGASRTAAASAWSSTAARRACR